MRKTLLALLLCAVPLEGQLLQSRPPAGGCAGTDLSSDANLISYWDLDGDGVDSEAAGNDLTASCTEDTTNYYQGTSSMNCTGGMYRADSSLSSGFPAKSGVSASAVSAICAIRPTSSPGTFQQVFEKVAVRINLNTDGETVCVIRTSGVSSVTAAVAYTTNSWQCVACLYDDDLSSNRMTAMHRISGTTTQASSNSANGLIDNNTVRFTLGSNEFDTSAFSGQQDHCVIFDRKLTQSEFESYCDNGLDGCGL